MKTPNASDRRVQRTRRTLREALIEVLLERGWEETSVQHVCDRADVGRSTFYTHFADKEDLLISGFEDLRKALRDQQSAQDSTRALSFARGMIEHAHEHRRLFHAIIGKRSGHVVQQRFRQLLVDLIREDLAALAPAGPHLDATVHYIAGAFFELLIWWLDAPRPLPPSELEQLFHRLTAPVLVALREHGRARRRP
ncbi:MAG: TetR/AcrR family transcriptional regulator [Myxococcaceae bacterium]|nr:TetR/AcrR family transcriptional regulator [Myxococcaceae bacterium]